MLMSHQFEMPHLGRRLSGFLQSPAEVNALMREEDVPECVLACASPEVPPRMNAALRATGNPDYLRLVARTEVDEILHGSWAEPRPARQAALRSPHAH